MFVWLTAAPPGDRGLEQLIAPLEGLAVLRRDLDERLRGVGAGSVEEVLEARARLLRALRAVPDAELREARAAVDEMRTRLMRLAARLAEVRALQDLLARAGSV